MRTSPSHSVLSRIDCLDAILGHLEEMRACRSPSASARTSTNGAVTTAMADDHGGSSPKSLNRRRCRPMNDVVVEAQLKGNIIDRVGHLEIRILKLEEEMEQERSPRKGKGGLKGLVRSCVKGDLKTKE